jgi:site-specific recombinase XerD
MTALDLTVEDCRSLADSWLLALRAERKSPETLKSYGNGIRYYLAWCDEPARQVQPVTVDHVPARQRIRRLDRRVPPTRRAQVRGLGR